MLNLAHPHFLQGLEHVFVLGVNILEGVQALGCIAAHARTRSDRRDRRVLAARDVAYLARQMWDGAPLRLRGEAPRGTAHLLQQCHGVGAQPQRREPLRQL